jgi:hypothetical protein
VDCKRCSVVALAARSVYSSGLVFAILSSVQQKCAKNMPINAVSSEATQCAELYTKMNECYQVIFTNCGVVRLLLLLTSLMLLQAW